MQKLPTGNPFLAVHRPLMFMMPNKELIFQITSASQICCFYFTLGREEIIYSVHPS